MKRKNNQIKQRNK